MAITVGEAFSFEFGRDIARRHRDNNVRPGAVVRRNGFALDIDTPGGLDVAISRAPSLVA